MTVVIRLGSTVNQLLLGEVVQVGFGEAKPIHGFHSSSRNDGPVHSLALALIDTEWRIENGFIPPVDKCTGDAKRLINGILHVRVLNGTGRMSASSKVSAGMSASPSVRRLEEDSKGDFQNSRRLLYSSAVQLAKWFTSKVTLFSASEFNCLIFSRFSAKIPALIEYSSMDA
jgi:hypothetical protein